MNIQENSSIEQEIPINFHYDNIIEERGEGSIVRRRYGQQVIPPNEVTSLQKFMDLESNQVYSVKIFEKKQLLKQKDKERVLNEIRILQSLNHQNIIRFHHTFEDENAIFILLEECSCKTLKDLLKQRNRLSENEVQRDLKLSNIFLSDQMEIKIGQFGYSAQLKSNKERRKTICGSPIYLAPEILEGNQSGYSFEVDIWYFGVILYTLLIGKSPFESDDIKKTYIKIKKNEFSYPKDIAISEAAKNLIQNLLVANPASRLNIDQILNHEFLASNNE